MKEALAGTPPALESFAGNDVPAKIFECSCASGSTEGNSLFAPNLPAKIPERANARGWELVEPDSEPDSADSSRIGGLQSQLPRQEMQSVLLAHIRRKAQDMNLPAQAWLVEELESEADKESNENLLPEQHRKSLDKVLARMPLLALVRQFPHSSPHCVQALLRALSLELCSANGDSEIAGLEIHI
mmetsp:Transcript_12016/g.22642  ORF Transcript_12016/g.22642 Transcript_12016/m.22642 type:complete len:186 (+) Transcript_12016:39-596(+)